jgi:hypothetical protein
MAHFAEINDEGIVLRVLVTDNNDPAGDEGYSWLVNNLGGVWVQTSYNATIRKNYAGVGFTYLPEIDAFVGLQPFDSWSLDDEAQWQAPTPYPEDDANYSWNESTLSWVEITGEN